MNKPGLKTKIGRDGEPMRGPGGQVMHELLNPPDFAGKLHVWRYLILRRLTQIGILLLFFGTALGWTLFGEPVLRGNLSGSELIGLVPLADPFATLQILLTRALPDAEVFIGAGLVLLIYGLPDCRTCILRLGLSGEYGY